ncbi:hypothetical protein BX666DRAFT_1861483, partial [Dichotomocladium elegans]
RIWNRDLAACLNFIHIIHCLRVTGQVPESFRRTVVPEGVDRQHLYHRVHDGGSDIIYKYNKHMLLTEGLSRSFSYCNAHCCFCANIDLLFVDAHCVTALKVCYFHLNPFVWGYA